MKKLFFILLMVTLFVLGSQVAEAQTAKDAKPIVVVVPAPAAQNASSSQEVAVLKAQLAEMKENNANNTSIVLGTLGIGATIVITFIVSGVFMNIKVYSRDKDAMRSQILEEVQKENRLKQEAADAHFKSLQEEIRKAQSEAGDKITKSATQKVDSIKQSLASSISDVESGLLSLKLDVLGLEYNQLLAEKSYSLAIERQCDIVSASMNERHDYRVPYALAEMKKCLHIVVSEGRYLGTGLCAQILELLGKLPESCAVESAVIKGLVAKARTPKDAPRPPVPPVPISVATMPIPESKT